jgi:hypothetical protein
MDEAQAGQAQLLKHYEAAFKARDLGQAWEVQKLVDQALLPAAKAQVAVFERLIALRKPTEARCWKLAPASARQRCGGPWPSTEACWCWACWSRGRWCAR